LFAQYSRLGTRIQPRWNVLGMLLRVVVAAAAAGRRLVAADVDAALRLGCAPVSRRRSG
jgi:hypothetical protein